jgi:Mycothiol maleylpyruvate isomerase N-terminal domain
MPAERIRHTRAEVAQRAKREFEMLDALLQRLEPADWDRPVPRPETRDPWTIKDALAHIVYWKSHTARAIRGERVPQELKGLEVKGINEVIYQRWRERPPADVLAWHREVQAEVMRTLEDKPEEWFTRRERAPYWPGDLDGHSAEHRVKDIEQALERD